MPIGQANTFHSEDGLVLTALRFDTFQESCDQLRSLTADFVFRIVRCKNPHVRRQTFFTTLDTAPFPIDDLPHPVCKLRSPLLHRLLRVFLGKHLIDRVDTDEESQQAAEGE